MCDVRETARGLQEHLVHWRRHFHMYPEVGADVPETSSFIARLLREFGLDVTERVGGYGLVGLLRGLPGEKTIAIRADMDALNVSEETELPFASRVHGKMHACGHDAHMAIALGAAKILSALRSTFKGAVKFIFQPAEEGPGGAKPMIEEGALRDPMVDAMIGLHVGVIWDCPAGYVGIRPGPMMAATDMFELTIRGKGGHGAMPHETVDAICVGAQVVTALQTIVSRRVSPLQPAVVTVGKFHAGTSHNVISGTASLEGTVRCLDEKLHVRLPELIERTVSGVCQAMGAEYELNYMRRYPVLRNDPEFTSFFSRVARDVVGDEKVFQLPEPTMGGEDMAYYLQEVPGTYFFLGARPSGRPVYPHHNPKFDIDEGVLWVGTALLAETARRWLQD